MRKLRRLPKAAILDVKQLRNRPHLRVHNFRVKFSVCARKYFRLRNGIRERLRRAHQIRFLVLVRFRHGQQHPPESRPSKLILRRVVRPAEKRLSVRHQKPRQRPAALPGNRADRRLITSVHIRTFIAIYFHRNKIFIDDFCDDRVLVTLAVNHVAPVAPHRADVEQHRLVFLPRLRKRFFTPFVPINRLVRRRSQIRARRILQPVFGLLAHHPPKLVGAQHAAPLLGYHFKC